jgi:hypothetical protein
VSIYETPPKSADDFLGMLQSVFQERMEREHENPETWDTAAEGDEVICADFPTFSSTAPKDWAGPALIVGPFRDGDKLYSFAVPLHAVVKVE